MQMLDAQCKIPVKKKLTKTLQKKHEAPGRQEDPRLKLAVLPLRVRILARKSPQTTHCLML